MKDRSIEARTLMIRWTVVLAFLLLAASWATCRMNRARLALESAVATGGGGGQPGAQPAIEYWTCTMHPEIRQPETGDCPICGMELVPKYEGVDEPGAQPPTATAGGGAARPQLYMCTMPECNDSPSPDPDSRCPVCGMKRESIDSPVTTGSAFGEVFLDERARRLAEVATETVEPRRLFKHLRTVGKVAYDETRHKMVTAWIDGRIDKLFADYTGMIVSAGDHLVELYSPELVTAQEQLLTALRGAEALKGGSSEALHRAERLVESAQRQLELLGITPEQIEAIKQRRTASTRLTIYAPIGGTVVRKYAMEGMYVDTGNPLYEIADLDYVWLLLDLYESDLPWIAPLQKVRVTADGLPGKEYVGQVAFVAPIVEPATRTIKVRVNVRNSDGRLKPEMFVNAEIFVALSDAMTAAIPQSPGAFVCPMHPWESSDAPGQCRVCEMKFVPVEQLPGYQAPRPVGEVLAAARSAVLRTGTRSIVYVETSPGSYRLAEVQLGPLAEDAAGGQYYPVLSGLRGGERVVVRGNFAIDSQMQLAGQPSLFSTGGGEASGGHKMHNGAHGPVSENTSESGARGGSVAAVTQPLCPVMGNEVDPEVFTDFHGQRIYFCCPACIKKFNADPEAHLVNLPAALRERVGRAIAATKERRVDD